MRAASWVHMPNITPPIAKDVLYNLYVIQQKSVLDMSRMLLCSNSKISRDLRKHGIKTRAFSTKGLKTRLGMRHSQETKEKIRQKALGRRIPLHVREKMGSPGSRNPGWIDGRTPENKRQRRTIAYKLWREAVFKRDDFTCQSCGKRGGKLNADHIKPFSSHPELRTSIDNGRTLCEPCHRKTETFGNGAKRPKKLIRSPRTIDWNAGDG